MHSSAMVSSALALSPSDLPAWSLGNLGGGQSPHRWEVSGETQEMDVFHKTELGETVKTSVVATPTL